VPEPSVSNTEIIRVPNADLTTIDIVDETGRRRSRSRRRSEYLEVDAASSYGDRKEVLMIDDRKHRPKQEEIVNFPGRLRVERDRHGNLSWVKPANS